MASFNNTTTATTPTTETGEDTEVDQYEETTELRVFRLALFSLTILASLIGNSVVCKAVWSMPFHRPFSYHLVANMAFAEILHSLCLPVMLLWQFEIDQEDEANFRIVNNIACILVPLQVLSIMVVTFSMATLAFYRCRVLINPNPGGPSRKVKILTISCLWLVPTAVSAPLFIGLGFKFENGLCVAQPALENDHTYVILKFIINFAIPYLVMLASYGAVVWNLRKRIDERATQTRNSSIPSTNTAEDSIELHALADNQKEEGTLQGLQEADRRRQVLIDANGHRCSMPESTNAETNLLKMIFAIIIIFVICYIPYQAMFLWERITGFDSWQFQHHSLMQKYVFMLKCLPSALHPVCYGTMNRFYAKAFSKIFLCKS